MSIKRLRWYFISKLYKDQLEVERFMILANLQDRSKTLYRFEVKKYPYKKYKLGPDFHGVHQEGDCMIEIFNKEN